MHNFYVHTFHPYREAIEVSSRQAVDDLFARLPSCISRDTCDQWALSLCFLNSRAVRKRAARALFEIPRGQLQLIPYYCRIAATLATVFPDLGQALVTHVEEEFQALLLKKDVTQTTLEPRLRNARFLGELAKFRLASPGLVFSLSKQLLDDFSAHNIDAYCQLLETAGRFLFKNPEASTRLQNQREIMLRLKNARHLDSRQSSLVDYAYLQCRPPEAAGPRKPKDPVYLFVKHQVLAVLTESNVMDVARRLRKLHWAQHLPFVLKSVLKVARGKFGQVAVVACLAAELARFHPAFGVALADLLLEEIRWCVEGEETIQ